MSCGVSSRYGLDVVLLWLWWRLAAAAMIEPLDWELPYATSMALKIPKKKKKKNMNLHRNIKGGWRKHFLLLENKTIRNLILYKIYKDLNLREDFHTFISDTHHENRHNISKQAVPSFVYSVYNYIIKKFLMDYDRNYKISL